MTILSVSKMLVIAICILVSSSTGHAQRESYVFLKEGKQSKMRFKP